MKKILFMFLFMFFTVWYTNANFIDLEEIEEFISREDTYNEEEDESIIELELNEDLETPLYIRENDEYIDIENTGDLIEVEEEENETFLFTLIFEWDYTNETFYIEETTELENKLSKLYQDYFGIQTWIAQMQKFLTDLLPVLVWIAFIFITINWWGAILSAVRNLFSRNR